MKKLHLDPAAEREATDIGKKFMNSTDVVGDMSRAYGTDLSSVKIHTDSAAAGMAAQRGVDAFSTGKDVFFGRGAFDRSDPASRGLLAHELSHSLQQGVGGMGGMQQSAPMGAEQGGLIDWFRGKSKRDRQQAFWDKLDSYDSLSMSKRVENMSLLALQRAHFGTGEGAAEESALVEILCQEAFTNMDRKQREEMMAEIASQQAAHGRDMKMIADSYENQEEGQYNAFYSQSGARATGLSRLLALLGGSNDDLGEGFVTQYGAMVNNMGEKDSPWTKEEGEHAKFAMDLVGKPLDRTTWAKENEGQAGEIANQWNLDTKAMLENWQRPEVKKRRHHFRWWLNR